MLNPVQGQLPDPGSLQSSLHARVTFPETKDIGYRCPAPVPGAISVEKNPTLLDRELLCVVPLSRVDSQPSAKRQVVCLTNWCVEIAIFLNTVVSGAVLFRNARTVNAEHLLNQAKDILDVQLAVESFRRAVVQIS